MVLILYNYFFQKFPGFHAYSAVVLVPVLVLAVAFPLVRQLVCLFGYVNVVDVGLLV